MKTERQQDQDVAERLRRENLDRVEAGGCAPPVLVAAPKDNEVDEKVMPEPLTYGMRRKGETAVIGLIPPKVHANPPKVPEYLRDYEEVPLYSAATVAELRAEVERLRGINSSLVDKCNRLNLCGAQSDQRADAAERRVGELEEVLGRVVRWCDGVRNHPNIRFNPELYETATKVKALTGADPT